MKVRALSIIAAVALSAAAPALTADLRASEPQPGTRGPVIQTEAPVPVPGPASTVVSA